MEGDEDMEGELGDEGERQDSPDDSQEIPGEGFPVLAEDDEDLEEEGVSQSVPSYQMSSQGSAIIRDVIVIDTDSESRESKEGEEKQEDEGEEEEEEEEIEEYKEEEEEDEDDDDAGGSGMRGGEESNEKSRDAEDDGEEEDPSEASNTEETVCGASSDSQHPSEQPHS
ncbi:nucleoprotein TPR-like protein, partial [Lates japonicus]